MNAETIAAIEEVEEMQRNPHLYKSYDSVEALFEDLNNDDWDDDELSENDLQRIQEHRERKARGEVKMYTPAEVMKELGLDLIG